MSSDVAIRVDGIGKQYRVGVKDAGGMYRYKSLRDSLGGFARRPWGVVTDRRKLTDDNSFWALKDVSFEVKQGEVVGIIGRNGAGKSTLLKILSQITKPTTGEIALRGRVGSLLEVGTGFHPELSGRENIYLNGAILGMTRGEVKSKFDEIVAFSEIERFLDTPVKQYSSGMYTRLAFAVAAHLEPEILVVDEVLAVGDAAFQKKCLGKMKDVAGEGRTVMFVSHNMGTVREICDTGVVLDRGAVTFSGTTSDAVDRYLQTTMSNATSSTELRSREAAPIRFRHARVTGPTDGPPRVVSDSMTVTLEYDVPHPIVGSAVILSVRHGGRLLFDAFDTDSVPELHKLRSAGHYQCVLTLPADYFVAGLVTIGVAGVFTARERFADFPEALAVDLDDETAVTHTGRDPRRQVLVQCPSEWTVNQFPSK